MNYKDLAKQATRWFATSRAPDDVTEFEAEAARIRAGWGKPAPVVAVSGPLQQTAQPLPLRAGVATNNISPVTGLGAYNKAQQTQAHLHNAQAHLQQAQLQQQHAISSSGGGGGVGGAGFANYTGLTGIVGNGGAGYFATTAYGGHHTPPYVTIAPSPQWQESYEQARDEAARARMVEET